MPVSNRKDNLIEMIQIQTELNNRVKYNKIDSYFPDEGPLRRELYKKHMAFFEAGAIYTERCCLAANRIGKTESMGGYEVTCHLTGIYPKWWKGRRFDRPTSGWAAGDTNQTVRDILQEKLLGVYSDIGSGLIPKHLILGTTPKTGVPEAYEAVRVKHVSGGESVLGFKSYDQKRKSFQGTKKDFIWEDEEPPLAIHTECLLRLMDTTGGNDTGLSICTYTPLEGISDTVMHFLPEGDWANIKNKDSLFVMMADWWDVPHISPAQRDVLLASIPVYQREARSKGIPQLGSGAIYPVAESDITVEDFIIPPHWPKLYAMDVGWNNTAGAWIAIDRETDTTYIYSVYKKGEAEPAIHAEAFRARGDWIKGKIDPAARGRSQNDGTQLLQSYLDLGLHVTPAKNAVEAGIYNVWEALSTGRLKVFASQRMFFEEYRLYRRDEKGKIIKTNDHCFVAGTMIATEYGNKPIESIKAGDKVWTRKGLKSVKGACQTGVEPVITYDINGHELTSTDSHPVFTENRGFVPIKSLTEQDTVYILDSWKESNGTATASVDTQSQTEGAIEFILNVPQKIKPDTFIERYGKWLTERYQKVTLSTIRMGTLLITDWRILRLFTALGTHLSTTKVFIGTLNPSSIWRLSDLSLLSGIVALKGRFGTNTTPSSPKRPNMTRLVKSVAKSLRLNLRKRNIATITVKRKHKESAPVYNLEVEDLPEYYANGVLVHNCLDCVRYVYMSKDEATVKPVKKANHYRQRIGGTFMG